MRFHPLAFVLAVSLAARGQESRTQSRPVSRPDGARLAIIKGRCLDAETGQPLAGVEVKLGSFGRNSTDQALHAGDSKSKDPDPVASDAEGRFTLRFPPHGGSQYTLELAAEGRVPRTGRWTGFQSGQVDDLGDIAFTRGYVVRGRVVDQGGKPVAKVGIGFHRLPLPIRPDMAANDSRSGYSGEDGSFTVAVPLPAGTWPIDVSGRGLKLVTPDAVLVRKDKGAEGVTVVVRTMPALSGTVVDETGQPVPLVYLVAETRAGSGRMASAWSRKDGTFVIHAVDDEPQPTTISISDPGPCEPPAPDGTRHDWGTAGIRIVLTRALTRELVVVVAGTGEPVEEYAVRCHSTQARSSLQTDLRLGGRHPGGKVTVDKIWRGENRLTVFPKDPSLVQAGSLTFDAAGPGAEPLRLELQRRPVVAVQVVDATGAPVAGSRVEIIDPRGEAVDATMHVPEAHNVFSSSGEYQGKRLVSFATTDGEGRARVFAAAGSEGLILRAVGPGHVPLVHRQVELTAVTQPVVIRVQRGGTVAGAVTPAALAELHLTIRVAGAEQASWTHAPDRVAGGRFTLGSLPPGEHTIEAVASVRFMTSSFGSGAAVALAGSRTKVTVADGQTTTVTLDLSAYAPARLEGIVTLDGKPPERARVVLAGRSADGQWRAGQFVPDEKGRFVAAGLLPGTYVPELIVGDIKVNEGTAIKLDEELPLEPGARLRKELTFRSQ